MKRIKPSYIIVAIVLAVVAVFVIAQVSAEQPGERTVEDNVVTETIDPIETNATVVFPVRLLEGSDPEHESEHMFEALAELQGVGSASLDTETLELTVAYDDALVDPVPIRGHLMESGYLAPTIEDFTATEVAADGAVQRISVDDDGAAFDPYLIIATAGVPVEIDFAPGQECRTVVKFPQIGIEQDISQGGTVALPALEPGEYQIACGGDAHEGVLLVQ